MKTALHITTLLTTLLITACNPSVHQLMRYEGVEALKRDTLYIVVYTDNETYALLDKYNQHRKSEKIKEERDKDNQALIEAFSESNYTFSYTATWYMEENDFNLPDGYYTYLQVYKEPRGENGEQEKLALHVRGPGHKNIATVSRGTATHRSTYKYLASQMDKTLHKMYRKGQQLQKK